VFIHPPRVPIGNERQMDQFKLDELIGRPFDTAMALARMILSGLFDRYPRLKLVLVENEVSWLPFVLTQWDKYIARKSIYTTSAPEQIAYVVNVLSQRAELPAAPAGVPRSCRAVRSDGPRRGLLDAALGQLEAGIGFDSLSLRRVTREAGVVPAAFYRHFANMDELGLALVEESVQTLREMLRRVRGPGTLQPDLWETKASWYDPGSNRANFLVTSKTPGFFHRWQPNQAALAALGRPARTYHTGPYTVYVYDKNLLAELPRS